jgi:hypothetical protein
MSESSPNDLPQTAGELRRRLAELGSPWTVDPRLGDDDPLPDYPRGGQTDEEVPEEIRPPAIEPAGNLRDLLSQERPINPLLQERWVEAGILAPKDVTGVPELRGEGVEQDEGS